MLFEILIAVVLGGGIGFGISYLTFGKKKPAQGYGYPPQGYAQLQPQWSRPQQAVQQPQHPPQRGYGQYPPR